MIGYLDLPSGISGDMFLGCLIDAGWTIDQLRAAITSLKLPSNEWSVEVKQVMKGSLRATLVDVKVAEGSQEHSHSHAHYHSHSHQHSHEHSHSHDHSHAHDHSHDHSHSHDHVHSHAHSHRNLDDIRKIISAADLPGAVKEKSIAVFMRLAHAEAKVHGSSVDQIHFHEVGALDAIVDIVGTVAGLHALGIEKLFASALPLGEGWIDCQHGKIPLPAPATLELLSSAGAPTRKAPGPGELVTPTGAALVCELATFAQPAMKLQKIAIGAGQRDRAWPNVARLWLGELESSDDSAIAAPETIVQLETNIDDMNPQLYGPLTERLLAIGARDVWITPIQMKKNRPGVLLAVLAPASLQRTIADLILRETTTLGVRVHPVHRHEADREFKSVLTPFGSVQVKLKKWSGHIIGAMPEFEDCRKLAEQKNVAVKDVHDAALSAARAFL
jgi:uncharacterized protein (TIGR00299 family) protein